MHVAGVALGIVEFVDQVARQLRALRAAGTDDDRVGTRVADHGDFLGLVVALGFQQLGDHCRDIHGDAVLHRHHVGVDGAWGVDAGDDLPYPCEVFRVVGDDDAVVAGVGVDRVVRRNDGAQHRDQVHRVFVLQAEGAGLHAIATGAGGVVDRPAQQFGVGFRDHLGHAPHVDHAEALHAQRRQQHVVGLVRRDLAFADQGQVALDPGVYQELLAGGAGQGAYHRLDLGVDEIQLHRLVTQRVAHLGRRGDRATGAVAQRVLDPRLGADFALAIGQRHAIAPGVGQGLAEFAVHQQGRRCGRRGVAAGTERQQQQRRHLAKRR